MKKKRLWDKYRKPHNNWTDDDYDRLQEAGLNSTDFKAADMQSILHVADKLGVRYQLKSDDSVIFSLETDIESAFNTMLRYKKCAHWNPWDFSHGHSCVTVHFDIY